MDGYIRIDLFIADRAALSSFLRNRIVLIRGIAPPSWSTIITCFDSPATLQTEFRKQCGPSIRARGNVEYRCWQSIIWAVIFNSVRLQMGSDFQFHTIASPLLSLVFLSFFFLMKNHALLGGVGYFQKIRRSSPSYLYHESLSRWVFVLIPAHVESSFLRSELSRGTLTERFRDVIRTYHSRVLCCFKEHRETFEYKYFKRSRPGHRESLVDRREVEAWSAGLWKGLTNRRPLRRKIRPGMASVGPVDNHLEDTPSFRKDPPRRMVAGPSSPIPTGTLRMTTCKKKRKEKE